MGQVRQGNLHTANWSGDRAPLLHQKLLQNRFYAALLKALAQGALKDVLRCLFMWRSCEIASFVSLKASTLLGTDITLPLRHIWRNVVLTF